MRVSGNVVALPFADIDTDQIIPAEHLTVLEPGTLGRFLFTGRGELAERFAAVNEPKIVIARENFGSGSSREHAVWALQERGVEAVIAPSFSRIFQENAYTNGLAPVVLGDAAVERCLAQRALTIDVDRELVALPDGTTLPFRLDPLRKIFLLGGGYLQFLASRISTIRAWELSGPRYPHRGALRR